MVVQAMKENLWCHVNKELEKRGVETGSSLAIKINQSLD